MILPTTKGQEMLKLELDWAADGEPEETPYEGEPMRVEFDEKPGPAGWPTVKVYVWAEPGEPAWMVSSRLQGWLEEVYGSSEDESEELADMAVEV
jgi:hypothetical protein